VRVCPDVFCVRLLKLEQQGARRIKVAFLLGAFIAPDLDPLVAGILPTWNAQWRIRPSVRQPPGHSRSNRFQSAQLSCPRTGPRPAFLAGLNPAADFTAGERHNPLARTIDEYLV